MIAEFSARMMTSLSYLSSHLLEPEVSSKALPNVNADGELIDNLKSLSVALGVDEQTAALYVLDTKDHNLSEVAVSQFQPDYFGSSTIDSYVKRIVTGTEVKRVRLVRSILGSRRFGQPRGTIIVNDGEEPIKNLIAVANDVPGYDKVADYSGRYYYIGEERGRWVVRVPGQKDPAHFAKDEKEAYYWLDAAVPKKGSKK